MPTCTQRHVWSPGFNDLVKRFSREKVNTFGCARAMCVQPVSHYPHGQGIGGRGFEILAFPCNQFGHQVSASMLTKPSVGSRIVWAGMANRRRDSGFTKIRSAWHISRIPGNYVAEGLAVARMHIHVRARAYYIHTYTTTHAQPIHHTGRI